MDRPMAILSSGTMTGTILSKGKLLPGKCLSSPAYPVQVFGLSHINDMVKFIPFWLIAGTSFLDSISMERLK